MTEQTDTATAGVTETTGAGEGTTAPAQAKPADTLLVKDEAETQEQAQAGEDQTAEDKPAEGSEQKAEVPEVYEFTFADGLEVDASTLGELSDVAKELGLTQEQAQKIADLGAKQSERWVEAQQKVLAEAETQWIESVRTDKEIGGDKLDENVAVAVKALDKFGTPELKAFLKESRLGNHPEMIRLAYRVGKAIADDSVVPGGRSTNEQKPFYPNSNHT